MPFWNPKDPARMRAMDQIGGMVDASEVISHWRWLLSSIPGASKKAVAQAVAWWHATALPHIPVGAGTAFRRTGRGMLRRTTRPYVKSAEFEVEGGIAMGAAYAIWLIAGTRAIAGGRVLDWRPGDSLIMRWPAKDARMGRAQTAHMGAKTRKQRARAASGVTGVDRQALPIVLPWQHEARDRVETHLMKGLGLV